MLILKLIICRFSRLLVVYFFATVIKLELQKKSCLEGEASLLRRLLNFNYLSFYSALNFYKQLLLSIIINSVGIFEIRV
jgi:hypothetical protein